MIVPALSLDEEARLAALDACAILDTVPEAAFEDLVELAHRVCGTSIAAISFIDSDRQWFKAVRGMGGMTEMPRAHAFCHYTIEGPETLVVADAAKDSRFLHNPFVTRLGGVRFYAGVPVLTEEGARVGTLCVLDPSPRILDPSQQGMLEILARQVGSQLALRRKHIALQDALAARDETARRLELLVDMQRCTHSPSDPAAVPAAMVACIARALDASAGGVWQVNGSGFEPIGPYWGAGVAVAPFVEATRTIRFTADSGLPGLVLRTGAFAVLSSWLDEPGVPRLTAALASGLASAVAVPVVVDGRVIAVFEVCSTRASPCDDEAIALLLLAAEELAVWMRAASRPRSSLS
jgi:GAF domain-containing protein